MDKRNSPILITGGTGFIGINLVNKLLDLEYRNINIFIRKTSNLGRLKNILKKIILHEVDLSNKNHLAKVIKKINPSAIFHLATYNDYRNQERGLKMIETNINNTFNLLMCSKDINYNIFVNTGSSSEYGFKEKPMEETDLLEPVSFYAATKAAATFLCQVFAKEYQKPIVTLRPFSVFGPYEEKKRFIPTAIKAILTNHPIKLTSGLKRRDFIYVQDIVNFYIKIINKGKQLSGEILNVGTGIEYSNEDIVRMLFEIIGKKTKIEKGAYPKRIWDTPHWVADISKSKKLLNWKPKYSLREGLRKTYFWFRKEYEK